MEMNITGTHFNYYQICKRKLWLFANGISMEHTSDLVHEGKLIHEESYPQRSAKYEEVEMDGIKVDYYDTLHKVIHEIKKSDKVEVAHEWQLKYYMYYLEQKGIKNIKAEIDFPLLRETKKIILEDEDREVLKNVVISIENIVEQDKPPKTINLKICKKCSYFDLCYV